jgi:hypothetical protein
MYERKKKISKNLMTTSTMVGDRLRHTEKEYNGIQNNYINS